MNQDLAPVAAASAVNRRTLVKGVGWSVPVIIAVGAAPAIASSASSPPPPSVDFSVSCGDTGADKKGCGTDKALQVAVLLTNQTGADVVFQVVSMYTCNCATAPSGPGPGVYSGVTSITSTTSFKTHNVCNAVTASTCSGGTANGSIVVPDGTVNAHYWLTSVSTGDASKFATTISWRWLSKSDCQPLSTGTASTVTAISPANC